MDALAAAATLEKLLGVLGFSAAQGQHPLSDQEVEGMVRERDSARKSKDFAKSDAIRKKLGEMGIAIEDRKDGTTAWRRK